MKVGKEDAFERRYEAKFRELAADYGEFVKYERDRGARDIGLHFTRAKDPSGEVVTSTIAWFQLKGKQENTLSKEAFEASATTKLRLRVAHLKLWFLQPTPTYLALYIESKDVFLVMDLQGYIARRWGKEIVGLRQTTVTVGDP